MDKLAIMKLNAKVRPMLRELEFLDRLEAIGLWALLECIDNGESDVSIAEMFDAMKERMLRQATTFRAARRIIQGGSEALS